MDLVDQEGSFTIVSFVTAEVVALKLQGAHQPPSPIFQPSKNVCTTG